MKLKFKNQEFQTKAVKAVTDCFKSQPNTSSVTYRIDPGVDQWLFALENTKAK